jgi:voltage-gated sodium channel
MALSHGLAELSHKMHRHSSPDTTVNSELSALRSRLLVDFREILAEQLTLQEDSLMHMLAHHRMNHAGLGSTKNAVPAKETASNAGAASKQSSASKQEARSEKADAMDPCSEKSDGLRCRQPPKTAKAIPTMKDMEAFAGIPMAGESLPQVEEKLLEEKKVVMKDENSLIPNEDEIREAILAERGNRANVFNMKLEDRDLQHENLERETYRVENFYKETGWAQCVARSDYFTNTTLLLICINAVYIGLDADRNDAKILTEAHWYFQVCEHSFCFLFTLELVIRFLSFERHRNCLRDGWFKFDGLLVALMVFETWIVSILGAFGGGGFAQDLPTGPLRLFRLLRLSRLVRLLRSMPELVTMIKGMRVAMRAVASSLVMIFLLLYVFGIIVLFMCAGMAKNNDVLFGLFGDLVSCMWTLLMDGTLMSNTGDVLMELRDVGGVDAWLVILIFLVFLLLSALTVLNMLIGVLCEVVSAVGQREKDEADVRLVKQTLLAELNRLDQDGDGKISQAEMKTVVEDKASLMVLQELDVDVSELREIHDMLFTDDPLQEIPIVDVMESFLLYRGDQQATVKHLVNGQAFTRHCLQKEVARGLAELAAQLHESLQAMLMAMPTSTSTARVARVLKASASQHFSQLEELEDGNWHSKQTAMGYQKYHENSPVLSFRVPNDEQESSPTAPKLTQGVTTGLSNEMGESGTGSSGPSDKHEPEEVAPVRMLL